MDSGKLPYDDASLPDDVKKVLEHHAERMLSYINKQATLTHALKSNPADKVKLQKGLAEECQNRRVPGVAEGQDALKPQELLELYDKELQKEPTCFEE